MTRRTSTATRMQRKTHSWFDMHTTHAHKSRTYSQSRRKHNTAPAEMNIHMIKWRNNKTDGPLIRIPK